MFFGVGGGKSPPTPLSRGEWGNRAVLIFLEDWTVRRRAIRVYPLVRYAFDVR